MQHYRHWYHSQESPPADAALQGRVKGVEARRRKRDRCGLRWRSRPNSRSQLQVSGMQARSCANLPLPKPHLEEDFEAEVHQVIGGEREDVELHSPQELGTAQFQFLPPFLPTRVQPWRWCLRCIESSTMPNTMADCKPCSRSCQQLSRFANQRGSSHLLPSLKICLIAQRPCRKVRHLSAHRKVVINLLQWRRMRLN